MFGITKYIKLNNKQKKIYLFLQVIIFGIFFACGIIFTRELLFPTQTFYFDATIDSLANTITRPYETLRGTSFHIATYGETDAAKITLVLPKDAPQPPKDTKLLVRKSYNAFLSPINTQKYTDHIVTTYSTNKNYYIEKNHLIHPLISENAFHSYLFKNNTADISIQDLAHMPQSDETVGFAPATLIASKESIYVTDGDKKHPIQDERAFLALGYNFDNVIKTNSEERAQHKKAKLFTFKSTHPFGTIFYTQDTDHTYIFDNNLLNKIQNTPIAKKHAIAVQEASRTKFASCILKKDFLPRHYTCTLSLTSINDFNGNTYQFILADAPNTAIAKTKIALFTTISKKSLAQRITALKRRLNTNYNEKIQ